MAVDDGGSAFPQHGTAVSGLGHELPYSFGGMSLRDYFAGQALAGALGGRNGWPISERDKSDCAGECYRLADTMLKERVASSTPKASA